MSGKKSGRRAPYRQASTRRPGTAPALVCASRDVPALYCKQSWKARIKHGGVSTIAVGRDSRRLLAETGGIFSGRVSFLPRHRIKPRRAAARWPGRDVTRLELLNQKEYR